ncbi:DUF2550 family protein [Actinotalea sp. C106]|uniref:DUF2550 family protein n=1 Tax=Actinotalea sp. C106 TaxID=2908644 RepID=UPI0020288305|nr:DUF2550 family protein [Actinotalea sp. C106]
MELVTALIAFGAVVLVLLAAVGLYVSRQSTLSGRVGSFTCSLREQPEGAWVGGIAQYSASRLLWWRQVSFAPRAAHSWSRAELTLLERIELPEADHRGRPLLLVRCSHQGEIFQLTMSAPACAGLVSWLEAGPRPVGRVI